MPKVKGATLVKDELLRGRWVAKCPTDAAPFSFSRCWNSDASSMQCLIGVVEWAWRAHLKNTGEKCPFRTELLPDIVAC